MQISAAAALSILLLGAPPGSASPAGPGVVEDSSALVMAAAPGEIGSGAPRTEPESTGVTVDAPALVLEGIPFTVRFQAGGEAVRYRLVTADGRELAAGEVEAAAEVALREVRVDTRAELPLTLLLEDAAGVSEERPLEPLLFPGWISLLPPLVAIGLALIFREVVISLFVGVWLGALFVAGLDPLAAVWRTVDRFIVPAVADADHAAILVFSLLLGGMVGVMSRSGGTRGIVEAVRPLATSPRRGQLATYFSGLAIFFDDYANTLIVGNTFRPITDRLKISREKLAYIVDSTAAPIAAIVFVSTWVGFEISLIADGLRIAAEQPGTPPELAEELRAANPFVIFIQTIPYLFYPILALLTVALVILMQRDFGPMWKAENRASRGDGLHREGAMLLADPTAEELEPPEGAPRRWYNAALPVLTVIAVVLLGLYFSGRAEVGNDTLWEIFGAADPFAALLWGSLAGCLVAMGLSVAQRILSLQETIDAWIGGMRTMMLAAVILILAWSLSDVTQAVGTAPYLSQILGEGISPNLMPALIFITAAAVAFATGTSWGTMAILIPLVIPLLVAMGGAEGFGTGEGYTLMLGSISSVLAGAIFGDHCSPISDTTVLSSMASACDHMDHVRTQLPYALLVGLTGIAVGDIPTAYGLHPAISYLVGGAFIFLFLRFVGRHDHDSPQWVERAG